MSRLAGGTGAAIALPLPSPLRWKRTSKPAVGRDRIGRPPTHARADQGLARRIMSVAAALPDHPWLDRVVRGRAWIPLLGVLLAGIVAAQVEILKLNANLGQALTRTSALTTQNEQLRGNVAQLGDDQRIARMAGAMGLVLPPPGAVGYLTARPGGEVGRALANIHAADSAAFVALAPHNGALVTGPGASTLPPPLGAPPPPATTTSASTTTSTGTTTSASTTTASATVAGSTSTPTSTTTPPATTSSQTTTPSSSTPPAGTSSSATTPTSTTPSQASASTGAAAIQPSGTSQTGGGG